MELFSLTPCAVALNSRFFSAGHRTKDRRWAIVGQAFQPDAVVWHVLRNCPCILKDELRRARRTPRPSLVLLCDESCVVSVLLSRTADISQDVPPSGKPSAWVVRHASFLANRRCGCYDAAGELPGSAK